MISSVCLPQSPFRISDSEARERASMPEVYKFGKTASSLPPIYSTSFLPVALNYVPPVCKL